MIDLIDVGKRNQKKGKEYEREQKMMFKTSTFVVSGNIISSHKVENEDSDRNTKSQVILLYKRHTVL